MSERPDLRLSADEQAALLRDVLAAEPVAWATPGDDGYPVIGLVAARLDGEVLVLAPQDLGGPSDDASVCVIVERGATYDDISAVVVRGTVRDGTVALDDVVTFAFAKAARRS